MADQGRGAAGAGTPAAPRRIRLCVVVTVDITLLNLCRGRFEYLIDRGFEVTAVCAPTRHAPEIEARGVRLVAMPLTRRITPFTDLAAIWRLYRFFRRERFDIVEVSTPKAALVGSIAARWAGVPCLVHLLRGLAYQGRRGLDLRLVRASHRVPCRLADRVIAVSHDAREQAIRDRLCAADRVIVLGQGSSNGVDLDRFRPASEQERQTTRQSVRIPPSALVVGFVGRLTKDKGIAELVDAFGDLAGNHPDLYLLLVGDLDVSDRPPERTVQTIQKHPRIVLVGWQAEPVRWMRAMDVFVLPTWREGFGTVLLEAAAMGLPVLTTQAAGWWSALDAGSDAIRVAAGDVPALKTAMDRLIRDQQLRSEIGAKAHEKVHRQFDCRLVWELQEREFRRLVGDHIKPCASS